MHSHAVPIKTPEGRQALKTRHFPGTRAQRSLLIMVDGRKTLAELSGVMHLLGLGPSDVEALVHAGMMGWAVDAVPTSLLHDDAAAALLLRSLPAPCANANRTPAAAKFFALDLLGRMLGLRDQDLRAQAREVVTAEQLTAWIRRCAEFIGQEAGEDRARLFIERVMAAMPAPVDPPAWAAREPDLVV